MLTAINTPLTWNQRPHPPPPRGPVHTPRRRSVASSHRLQAENRTPAAPLAGTLWNPRHTRNVKTRPARRIFWGKMFTVVGTPAGQGCFRRRAPSKPFERVKACPDRRADCGAESAADFCFPACRNLGTTRHTTPRADTGSTITGFFTPPRVPRVCQDRRNKHALLRLYQQNEGHGQETRKPPQNPRFYWGL